jgi:hypothetical protein
MILKQEADSARAGRGSKPMDLLTADLDRSTARRQRAGDAAQQRRLPASVPAEHGQNLAPVDVQRDVTQDVAWTVAEAGVAHADQWVAHCHVPLVRRRR